MSKMVYAGIDAGGTGFKCIVGSGPDNVKVFEKVPVASPEETLAQCLDFFNGAERELGPFQGLGVASFGPLDLQKQSPTYGCITSTPKPLWSSTNILEYFKSKFNCPIAFDTDVNGALMGELQWGAAQNLHSAVYVTIGTGLGAGVMVNGRVLYGAMHTEVGHMLLPRHKDDTFHGVCPFHGACLEGLASGPAIAERWQEKPKSLAHDHPAWELEAHYLAAMCVNLSLMYSPQRIILGGGVMQQITLLNLIRRSYLAQINGYLGDQTESVADFIVGAKLGERAGALGALAMAQQQAGPVV